MNATERAEILDRLAAGQLSAAEAMRLLEGGEVQPAGEWPEEVKATAADIPVEELKADVLKVELPEEATSATAVVSNGNFVPDEGRKARWLRIQVSDMTTGRRQVSINLPIGFVSLALGVAKRFNPDMRDMDTDDLAAMFKSGQRGMLIDVEDDDDNKKVQIFMD
ncbi:MAG: hypothetical protein KBG73_06690 [Candidatus Promineofilum sp.]|nr:hypothetical protein [Promineifilum sp.]